MTIEQVQKLARKETKLVGFMVTASLNQDMADGIVDKLRTDLLGKRHEIGNVVDDEGMYLVQVYPDCEWTPDVPFVHIVGVEVHDFTQIPDGFISHTISAGNYAKIVHIGPESQIGDTYDAINERGLGDTRAFDFEYWKRVVAFDQNDSSIDIYIPL
ncbi:GyrI-like domain-containing protein [Brevibacillus reuszeri]|uniref:GyrI-like domain-containing protein n=1 Tax=Brevibacillus reuszeri TaxID=54915 RepID=UPI00289E13FC|nr:effector binding domain-containing protein [Brevibacillus reuszeri]